MSRKISTKLVASGLACGIVASGVAFGTPALAEIVDQNGANNSMAGPFVRTATYPVYQNVPKGVDPADETVAEISSVSGDGKTMIYTDAAGKRIGFLDISDPANPKGKGSLDLATLGNADDQPTSVAVAGDYVLVVIDETGGNFTEPKGRVDVVKLSDHSRVASIDLKGQPDSIAISEDGKHAAIAMENQRDEENEEVDGGLPQLPGGFVQTLKLDGDPSSWAATPVMFNDEDGKPLPIVENAGLDTPEDLEPEYVSFNSGTKVAVTLQENNGIAILDAATGEIESVFSAGDATVKGVDATKDGLIKAKDSISGPREPDAIGWIDDSHIATANEGDWKGGTRGWTVFDTEGNTVWDAGNSLSEIAIQHGLHNEKRAEKKGSEPEGIALATMNGKRYAFVGSERSNFVAVYDVDTPAKPKFVQLLFTTNGPEGILPIPERNMLAVSSEVDEADNAVRSSVGIYQLDGDQPEVPQPSIVSDKAEGQYIGWTALGALTADQKDATKLFAASDSALSHGQVYTVDASQTPARITEARTVMDQGKPAEGLDIEGLATRKDGGFWLASEGKTGAENALIRTDDKLNIEERVSLPEEISKHIGKWGLEGVDSHVNAAGEEEVFFAVQRPLWEDPEADDRKALEGENTTRIGKYNVKTKEFDWFSYELEGTDTKGDWMGLSEITVIDDKTVAVIERDKLNGPNAKVKRVVKVTLPDVPDADAGGVPPAQPVTKADAVDVLPYLKATNGWTQEKLEGFTIASDGQAYAVTDNDGLDDATGETVFLRLGKIFDAEEPPAEQPGDDATDEPSDAPSEAPGEEPGEGPSEEPGEDATDRPSETPGEEPGEDATDKPAPSEDPSEAPAQPGDGSDDDSTSGQGDSNDGKPLPRTGVSVAVSLGLAALLVGVGGAAVLLARRKK